MENKILQYKHSEDEIEENRVKVDISRDAPQDIDILELSDISFLMNHVLDEMEANFSNENEFGESDLYPEFAATAAEEREMIPLSVEENENQNNNIPQEFSQLQDEFIDLMTKYDTDDQPASQIPVQPEENITAPEIENNVDQDDREENIDLNNAGIVTNSFHSHSIKQKMQFLKGKSTYQIGLDIGSYKIKYVIAKKQKNGGQIQAFGFLLNPFKESGEIDKIVDYLIDELNIKSNYPGIRCAFTVHGRNVGVKRHAFPKMSAKLMKDAIFWTAKKEFGFEDTPALFDSISIGKTEKKGVEHEDCLLIACEEQMINQMVEPFLARKLIPFKAAPLAVSLWDLYKNSHVYHKDKTVALIDLGAKKTIIVFIRNGVLEFTREIPTGGRDITESLTGTIFYDGKPYQFDQVEAESLKLEYGFPDEELEDRTTQDVPVAEYSVLMRPILERMGSEIQRSIDYFREKYSADSLHHVYLTGGTSQFKNIIPFLSGFIDTDMGVFPLADETPHKLSEDDYDEFRNRFGELAVAYSSATDYNKKLNLLPNPVKKIEKIKLIQRFSLYSALIGLLLLAMLTGFSFMNAINLNSQFDYLKHKYEKLAPLKQKYDTLQKQHVYLKNKKDIYTKELKLQNPFPAALKVIANLFPRGMAVTNVTVVNANAGQISGKEKKKAPEKVVGGRTIKLFGVCYHPRPDAGIQIADYLRKLNSTGLFSSLTVVSQHYLEEFDQLKFEIVGKMN